MNLKDLDKPLKSDEEEIIEFFVIHGFGYAIFTLLGFLTGIVVSLIYGWMF